MVMVRLDGARQAHGDITTDLIREWVDKIAALLGVGGPEDADELEQLVRDLEADYNVYVGNWTSLADDGDHVKWLEDRRSEIKWAFWERYERLMREQQGLPPASVTSVADTTDDILARLEAPDRPGAWDRRGLVAGQVQSGKTGNYIGLVAKALDSGYKLVVVLAGVHNSLRSQTQARIDEGILGFDTRKNLRFDQAEGSSMIGVGRVGGRFLPVNSFTSSKQNGDFSLAVARNIGVVVGGNDPIVLVVKKNKSILTNLYNWATALRKETNPETGRPIVRGVPVLVIDDEADHASVDTNGPKAGSGPRTRPTRPQSTGSSASSSTRSSSRRTWPTPPPPSRTSSSPATGNTASPARTSSRAASSSTCPRRRPTSAQPGCSVCRAAGRPPPNRWTPCRSCETSRTTTRWLPDGHKADASLQGDLPAKPPTRPCCPSCSAGRCGDCAGREPSTTRCSSTSRASPRSRPRSRTRSRRPSRTSGTGFSSARATIRFCERRPWRSTRPTICPPPASCWARTMWQRSPRNCPHSRTSGPRWPQSPRRRSSTRVNGTSQDALEYVDHPDGLSVIAIGGDKLSRGLTLEGLSVSYYLRASKMYDTLMQMGRWFGYRPGYLDVCRLYTTPHLVRWYVAITAASAELQSEFEAMAALGRSPEQYGLRVRQHPDGLLVTSPSKLRHSTSLKISYAATITETTSFAKGAAARNWAQLERLITVLGPEHTLEGGLEVWRDVSPDAVVAFLKGYVPDAAAIQTQPKALTDYIQSRLADGELSTWTVAVANVSAAEAEVVNVAGVEIGLTRRAALEVTADRYTVRRVGSPRHEIVDLGEGL